VRVNRCAFIRLCRLVNAPVPEVIGAWLESYAVLEGRVSFKYEDQFIRVYLDNQLVLDVGHPMPPEFDSLEMCAQFMIPELERIVEAATSRSLYCTLTAGAGFSKN
jgi:hypothetical protein